jgi:hypothetical protein
MFREEGSVAKKISASVGVGGANRPADVFTIQYLLNLVPNNRGGPAPELAVDAICGPLTKGAIQKFQKASGAPTDGRVDPGGPTFRNLLAYDPYPNQDLTAAMASKLIKVSSTAQRAAAAVIVQMIGEAVSRDYGKWAQQNAMKMGKASYAAADASAKAVIEIMQKATAAAAKVVETAAKQGGLPVAPNPFGPPPEVRLQELVRQAIQAAQKVSQETAKLVAGGSPGKFAPAPIAGASYLSATLAKAITDSAMKIAGEAAKAGKTVQSGFPSPSGHIGDLSGKIAGAIKQATEAAAKMVEAAAKSVGKM